MYWRNIRPICTFPSVSKMILIDGGNEGVFNVRGREGWRLSSKQGCEPCRSRFPKWKARLPRLSVHSFQLTSHSADNVLFSGTWRNDYKNASARPQPLIWLASSAMDALSSQPLSSCITAQTYSSIAPVRFCVIWEYLLYWPVSLPQEQNGKKLVNMPFQLSPIHPNRITDAFSSP